MVLLVNISNMAFKNALIAFMAPLPSIIFYISFLNHYQLQHDDDGDDNLQLLSPLWNWCYQHPLLLANTLFFFNIDVGFWLISLLQSSNWMIDLYWTVIPVLLVHLFANHPNAEYNQWRSMVVVVLTWVWATRLTHNYFRREKWQWGAREDWRFTNMAEQHGQNWWWVSFFGVYLIQQPLNIWDIIAVIVCMSGIVYAYLADTQLHTFVSKNERLKEEGKAMVPNLDEGLWYYSRHPNYFGEQLWWWGLAIFGWNLGCTWAFVGALMNTLCLAYVTTLVEKRMLKQEYRVVAYKMYQKTTSIWVPWFKSSPKPSIKDE
ncbi:3-oxo-5-alpha-steroid 4-dehydrogenase, C-terminal [Cynara cardunculus var. scolymus]|uniref:3-oxo-5-alpha-steroid 4-dehydrogenase, C-terminal n=1 Tax=Cynara cardunculus var. scolymus TaxID=59895 RepID=A0A118JTA0_CYNCS|nr:3-oxo-5-alpha-steroid 4-dehydrogenase, C-terminal [Cynara cardunculus var. scolymus]